MESWPKKVIWLTATAFSCLFNVHQTSAAPAPVTTWTPENQSLNNASLSSADFGVFTNKIRDNSIPLRILGLGASIMAGWGSPSYNGGRKPLRDALRQDGWDVDMVGSLKCGNMVDNDCEAVAGDVLTQILARVPHSLGYKPNIVIINGGTNDANGPAPGSASVSTAGNRMNDILNALWGADGMSNTCIMLSTLIPTNNANGMVNVPVINNQYRALVTQRAAEGKCIYLAEMWPNGDSAPWLLFDTHYLATESPHVHPNDKGHSMMASVFYNSILSAISDNRIVVPGEMVLGSTVCDKVAGTGVDAGGLTQRGSGYDDGIYYHNSAEQGVVLTLTNNYDRGDYKWARLFNRNYDDLLIWNNHSATSQVYAVFANSADGKGTFKQTASAMDGDLNCEYPEGVNFIDMNGDGLDDLVYIDADGNAYLSINQGDGDRGAGKPPTFKRVSSTAKIMDTNGYDRPFVVLADIDGDGRGDFGRIDYDGNVKFWRNGGTGDSPSYWQALGQRWASKNYAGSDLNGNFEGTRFEDVNGDGRDDMVWLDQDGSGHVWTNSRSCGKGLEGDGLKVAWREGFYQGGTSKAYAGMGAYVTKTETNLRHRIHFARIYGEVNIFGNLPRQDYVFMEHSTIGSYHQFKIRVWKNTGGGGTKLKGDGNKYCNMMGHSNGMVDYVWTYSFGTMEMWANRGKGKISDSDPDGYWDYQGTIWTPPNNINRKDLHLSDWDGDGACNIIYVNPDNGAVKVWLNRYPKEGNFDSWNSIEYLPSTMSCSEKRGLGFSDLAVRFADITGNGRADYLCISPDTTVKGYIHNSDGSFTYHDQIKLSIGKDRANLRWADVNGDGREDMLWIEKFSGDTFVYYNEGPKDPSQAAGSSFGWRVQDEVAYAGQVAGSCEYFADLNGDGFADEHYLSDGTSNNKAMTSLSPGCGLIDNTGDDSDMTSDLPLPTVPGSGSGGGGGGSGGNTGEGCISGTGTGEYSALCNFVCARGYCPAPCSCTATGTYNSGTEDNTIDGYANVGYDQATFTPLCNFACSHYFCPDECLWTDIIDPDVAGTIPALPALDDYIEDVEVSAGAFYRYQFPEDPNMSVSILYAGNKISLPSDITCANITPGDNGALVGCVGDTVEWLFLSLSQDPDVRKIEGRDEPKPPSTSDHTFTPLPHLQPGYGCSLHCQLNASAPRETWTPVGEGTLKGRAHSLHFMHTGKSVVFKATAGSLNTANLQERVESRALGAALTFEIGAWAYMINHLYNTPDQFKVNVPNLVHPIMDAAVGKVLNNCLFVVSNDSATISLDTIETGFGVMIAPSTSLAIDTDTVDSISKTCEDELKNKRRYIVWPRNGNDVDSLRTQLFLLDPATEEHKSVNSWGTMYFISRLTILEAAKVTSNKQCMEVEPHCENNHCEDPSLFKDKHVPDHDVALDKSIKPARTNIKPETIVEVTRNVEKRDGMWTTQDDARPELAFISRPSGSTRNSYVYDATPPDKQARVYILDGGYIDVDLPEFTTVTDSTGKTMKQKATLASIGPEGWTAADARNGLHGTAMLTFLAGGSYGVAREAVPYGVTFAAEDGHQWVINALDDIERDWKATKAAGLLADICVLSMSFGYLPDFGGTAFNKHFADRLKALDSLDMLSIVAAGNDGEAIKTVPQIFADSNTPNNNHVNTMLVVGAVDSTGIKWQYSSTASFVTLYAPGVDCTWKSKDPATGAIKVHVDPGTSIAAAKVAGQATQLLGLPDISDEILDITDLRSILLGDAYPRVTELAVYNGAP